ncbi:iron ABC transporter permease [Nesterenkonia sp. NBAIMH1]|uniref:FecCD family ABC transporter permease n=1 Tax=Nesterenkonia sp. NBAIMH1 TaxID=2600320 RepID=UPI0011B7685A|nr:iron chelate uptake ABC transporter family permease subunit [Nesterenkonia sp. NBAIMH1]
MTTAPDRAERTASRAGLARTNARRAGGLVLLVACLTLVCLLSVSVGSKSIPPGTVFEAFSDYSPQHDELFIVRELRLPRTIVAVVVGTALGVAGALVQALTRNPLADPGILGVNAGAAFMVAIGIGVFGAASVQSYVWFAFLGALIVTLAVYLIGSAGRGPTDPVRLTLAGVALGAVLSGATTGLMLIDPQTFDHMRAWNAGSVVGRGYGVLLPVVPFIAAGVFIALAVTRSLNAIALGEDLAVAMGARVRTTRVLGVIAVTLLAGGATALAGPIGFVGLMIPHAARWITGPDQRWIFAYTMIMAPLLLVLSDTLGRIVMRPGELPVGIVTAFVGAPVLIVLVRRKRASGL